LTSANERGYEVPFAQLLATEGHEILQGPVHHAHEQGKDIFTRDADGALCAYQLKGPDISLSEFGSIEPQLWALSRYPLKHSAINPPKRADKVFLVTNGRLTPPVQERIRDLSAQNVREGMPPLGYIEREMLLGRFLVAHGRFLPTEPQDFRHFLELYLSNGRGPLPRRSFSRFLEGLLPLGELTPSAPECARAAASATLFTTYVTSAWSGTENYVAVAEGWLLLAACLVRLATRHSLDESRWLVSYSLAIEAARGALAALVDEASEAEHLVVPSVADGVPYAPRAMLVCGYAAAYFLSEQAATGGCDRRDKVRTLLLREMPYAKLVGEAAAPCLYNIALALDAMSDSRIAEGYVSRWARDLSRANQPHSEEALPDPYHDVDDLLLEAFSPDMLRDEERWDGQAYTLHVAIEWLARRHLRQHIADIWADVTRVEFLELRPSQPEYYLAMQDTNGILDMRQPPMPESWARISASAETINLSALPKLLCERRELLPYLPLLFPHRLTSDLAKGMDHLLLGRGRPG